MKAVTIFKAKTPLSRLVNEVLEKGQQIAITKHGHIVAMLVPIDQPEESDMADVIKDMRALSAEISKKGITLKEIQHMRGEGRK